jgi:hypothetical protein
VLESRWAKVASSGGRGAQPRRGRRRSPTTSSCAHKGRRFEGRCDARWAAGGWRLAGGRVAATDDGRPWQKARWRRGATAIGATGAPVGRARARLELERQPLLGLESRLRSGASRRWRRGSARAVVGAVGWPERRRARERDSQVAARRPSGDGQTVHKADVAERRTTLAGGRPGAVAAARLLQRARGAGPTTGPKPPLPQSSGIGHAFEKARPKPFIEVKPVPSDNQNPVPFSTPPLGLTVRTARVGSWARPSRLLLRDAE